MVKWDGDSGGWLSGGCPPSKGEGVALVLSVDRIAVDVHRLEEGQGSFALVVYAGTTMSPVVVLAQAKPLLSDQEASELARALGFA